MPSITLKSIPDELYDHLKSAARAHHRSINGELIHCLENAFLPRTASSEEWIEAARVIRAKVATSQISADDIDAAKKLGRK